MERERIVVIEDEDDILEVIEHNLSREGYAVFSATNGGDGLQMVKSKTPDLVLLDLMLPGMDGIEVCRKLKSNNSTKHIPIIMVTAKGEESDIVLGLGIGADDYVVKPFSPKELVSRVKAVLRRGLPKDSEETKERIVHDEVSIDAGKYEVRIDGTPVNFTLTEFRILHLLASHPGRVFTRNVLLNSVIGDDAIVVDRNIDVHIRAVRKKLGKYRDFIETIRGVGYRFHDKEG